MRTLLVVDDDTMFRELIAEVLENAGYRVISAIDGQDGWDRLQVERADMAVLDLNMPRKDGLELTKMIRSDERYRTMPILMLTIQSQVEDQVSGYARGADDYLTKPFDLQMLVARVRVLERRLLTQS